MNEERFRIAVTQTRNVIFDYNIPDKEVTHSRETMHLYGLPETMGDVPESFVRAGIIPRNTPPPSFACTGRSRRDPPEQLHRGDPGGRRKILLEHDHDDSDF